MEASEQSRSDLRSIVEGLCREAFQDRADEPSVVALADINRGRGAFSEVLRVGLEWPNGPDPSPTSPPTPRPGSVVAKVPVAGPNGRAARASGAYRREALAYRDLLARSPIAHPEPFRVVEADDGACSLVLEDLTDHRSVDQLEGLGPADAIEVAVALSRFHRAWSDPGRLAELAVRRNTLAQLDPAALRTGLQTLGDRWGDVLDDDQRQVYADLVAARSRLIERFEGATPTLCHGDPRADNLFFDRVDGSPILFDWQQMAVQQAEADLAWLSATSLTIGVRRRIERDLVAAAGGDFDRYRAGLALPGLTVLLLAQRELPAARAQRSAATSLARIAAAVADNETARLGTA